MHMNTEMTQLDNRHRVIYTNPMPNNENRFEMGVI